MPGYIKHPDSERVCVCVCVCVCQSWWHGNPTPTGLLEYININNGSTHLTYTLYPFTDPEHVNQKELCTYSKCLSVHCVGLNECVGVYVSKAHRESVFRRAYIRINPERGLYPQFDILCLCRLCCHLLRVAPFRQALYKPQHINFADLDSLSTALQRMSTLDRKRRETELQLHAMITGRQGERDRQTDRKEDNCSSIATTEREQKAKRSQGS